MKTVLIAFWKKQTKNKQKTTKHHTKNKQTNKKHTKKNKKQR